MDTTFLPSKMWLTASPSAVAQMPPAVFVERWRFLTGEPPAIMLDSHRVMLALLVESAPSAPFEGPVPSRDFHTLASGNTGLLPTLHDCCQRD